ncbi:MAG: hypothetical protein ACREAA_00100 [Candidatus Polarisedimenticolia bacterium]
MRTNRTTARRSSSAAVAAALLLVCALASASRQETPPVRTPTSYDQALDLYRAGQYKQAAALLERSMPDSGTERSGYLCLLGWSRWRLKETQPALAAFRKALALSPGNADALEGVARSAARLERDAEALEALLELARDHPEVEVGDLADQVFARPGSLEDHRVRRAGRPATPAAGPAMTARARGDYLEVRGGDGRWAPLFVKGINLGAALPGKYPSEFPRDEELYVTWLRQMSEMGANAVRLYTLLPPEFYRALARVNADNDGGRGPLWLLQGVWTELPEDDAYDAPDFQDGFRREMERVIDAVHGNIAVARRHGHAYGLYTTDVSSMTLGYILGREWEPYSVAAYDEARPRPASFKGSHVTLETGTPMEAWIASVLDHALQYQDAWYAAQTPVSFTSWPTLDPIDHPTEATRKEEVAWLRKLRLPQEPGTLLEYDNDSSSIDIKRMRTTSRAPAGLFASFHAYPYYPDFMNVDPGYLKTRDGRGPSNYLGYMRQLKKHHAGIPLLIAEVGVPTSRGISHHQPQGWHHGGHTETGQGEIDARLMENIHEARAAGGVLFAWIDEWFKKNWLVIAFEVPWDNNKNWLNILDPEQNYGLLACKPGRDKWKVEIDGKGADWRDIPMIALSEGPVRALRVTSDEAYIYLRLEVARLDWKKEHYLIGIDTYGAQEGDHRMPRDLGLTTPTGMEFVVEMTGPKTSRVLCDTPYDLHTHRFDRPWKSSNNEDGRFVEMLAETNRRRIGRDGTVYPPIVYSRSPLRFGTMDPSSPRFDDLVEWNENVGEGFVELRLGWNLLNVTDPSTRQVLNDPVPPRGGAGHSTTDGFRFYVAAFRPGTRTVTGTLPGTDARGRFENDPPRYTWETWSDPTFHTYLKKSYFILRERLAPLAPLPGDTR